MKALALAVRFFLELAMLAALCFGALRALDGPVRWLVALGSPALVAALWGVRVAPKSKRQLRDPARLAVEVALFGAAGLALVAADHPRLGIALAASYALDRGVLALG